MEQLINNKTIDIQPCFNNNSEVKILQVLAKNWYMWFNTNKFSKLFGMSRTTLYRNLEKLQQKDLIQFEANRFRINITSIFAYNFKLFYDFYRLSLLDEDRREDIQEVLSALLLKGKENIQAIFIFGSVANFDYKDNSDTDFFIILDKEEDVIPDRVANPNKFNIQTWTREQFEKAYLSGDDFIYGCLHNNLVLFDRGFFRDFLQRELFPIPRKIIMQRKDQYGQFRRRVILAVGIKDYGNAVIDYKKLLVLKARIKLLEKRIVPKTKYETLELIKRYDKSIVENYNSVNVHNVKELIMNE